MLTTHFRPLVLFLASFVCALVPSVASATHSWGGYHWFIQNGVPVTVRLGDNLSGAWNTGYLNPTATKWQQGYSDSSITIASAVLPRVEAGLTENNVRKCWPTAQTVQVCNTTYGKNGWLGVAQIWVSSLHIAQGTVKLNDTYFNTATYNKPAWRNLVICQEVGHTFGLDHQDTTFGNKNLGTCMDYTSDPDGTLNSWPSNEWPNKHDFEELAIIYGHIDGTTSSTATASSAGKVPPGMFRDLSDQSEWGKLIRESYGGRTAVYERDFGGGHKVFTFVIRAE